MMIRCSADFSSFSMGGVGRFCFIFPPRPLLRGRADSRRHEAAASCRRLRTRCPTGRLRSRAALVGAAGRRWRSVRVRQRIAARPAGDHSAGAFDDWHDRGDVPVGQRRIEHHVGATCGEREIAEAIAPGAVKPGAADQRCGAGAALLLAASSARWPARSPLRCAHSCASSPAAGCRRTRTASSRRDDRSAPRRRPDARSRRESARSRPPSSRSSAISVPNRKQCVMKARVPSIGSRIHR